MKAAVRRPSKLIACVLLFLLCLTGVIEGCSDSGRRSADSAARPLRPAHWQAPAPGPLRVSAINSRYFADGRGKLVYLTGSHTWNNFQDWGTTDPPPQFDYARYLEFLADHGHNFFRLYVWEQAFGVPWTGRPVWFSPLPYQRTGPGMALDGRPRFNLHAWNPDYFQRLRERVQEAGNRGIYVSVMLFNGWSVDAKSGAMTDGLRRQGLGDPWKGHPFNPQNNVNGIDGGAGGLVHSLGNPLVTELQKAYVRKVIDTVGDLDNVLWEISNESNGQATAWEYEMIRFIHQYEATRPKQHPVGMTAEFPGGVNSDLWNSPADWISPGSSSQGDYALNPPAAAGGKVIVSDTDHIWGIGGSPEWVWKSFTRGLNPIFMDPYQAGLLELYPLYPASGPADPRSPEWEAIRRNLGYAAAYAQRINLAAMVPHPELASSGYCLADSGSQYLVYVPRISGWRGRVLRELPASWPEEAVQVDLSRAAGAMSFEWFRPESGTTIDAGMVAGGAKRSLSDPMPGEGMVLYIHTNRGGES